MVLASAAFAALRYLPARNGQDTGGGATPVAVSAASLAEADALYKEGNALYMKASGLDPEKDKDDREELLRTAQKKFYAAYQKNPTNPKPLKGLGLYYEATGDAATAIKELTEYVSKDPPPPDADAIKKKIAVLKDNLK